jgi:hypothetical protein
MTKFISVPLAAVVDSGTTTTTTANKLTQSGQDFLTTVKVGDIIVNTTDSVSAVVTAVDSNTVLSISADVVPTAKAFVIYSATVTVDQIIAAEGATLVQQATLGTTTIAYRAGSTGADILTITHSFLPSGSVDFRTAVQNALIEAADKNSKPKSIFPIALPASAAVISTAIA